MLPNYIFFFTIDLSMEQMCVNEEIPNTKFQNTNKMNSFENQSQLFRVRIVEQVQSFVLIFS